MSFLKFYDISNCSILRASLSKIDGKNDHVKFCFYKIHVSLDLGINTEPTPPIKMGGHAPRGKIADPPISRVQNRDFTFLLLEPQDEEILKMWIVSKMFLSSCPFEICAAIPDSISGSLSVRENTFCKQTAATHEADLWPKIFLHIFNPCTLSYL